MYQNLIKYLGKERVFENKNISPYITLRTETVAEFYFEARSREEFLLAIKTASDQKIPIFLLGGGSNLAIMNPYIKGLVIRNQYQELKVVQDNVDSVDLFVSSGYPVGRLVKETVDHGYEGFEYHLGLPGSVGGAIFMNSKWTKNLSYFGDSVVSATLIDRNGNTKTVDRNYFQFAYDYSILQKTKELVVDITFHLKKVDSTILRQRSQDALAYRKQTQPFGVATSGCFFRNISDEDKNRLGLQTTSAGYLIDKSGLKNMKVGDFIVSDKHANFIINTGQGKAEDLVKLIGMIKDTVNKKYAVTLEEEVVIV